MTTTSNHLNEIAAERELRFLDWHILRLEDYQNEYRECERVLADEHPDEDERREIHERMTDLEIELVLLPACYDRKVRLERES